MINSFSRQIGNEFSSLFMILKLTNMGTVIQHKLSNLQIELLKVFSRNLSDVQLLEIKQILANYFAQKATEEMDKIWDEKGWTNETMEGFLKEKMRTPY